MGTPSLRSRSVVVTGASSGIGEAISLDLAAHGFRVFAGVRRSEDGVRLARCGCGTVEPVVFDVTDGAALAAVSAEIDARIGELGLGGLINNAGVASFGPLEHLPIDRLRAQIDVNVVGPIATTQALLPLLRRGRGRIVNMSSISGRISSPFLGAYAASKFALEALTDALRMELIPWQISVVLVAPGKVRTPIWSKSLAAAQRFISELPPEALALYGRAMTAALESQSRLCEVSLPPGAVARVVRHALTTPWPRTRYLVGTDAKAGAWLRRVLPDRALDWFLRRRFGQAGVEPGER